MTTLLRERSTGETNRLTCRASSQDDTRACEVGIRPVDAHEAERVVVELFEAMSDTARYFRFLSPMPRLPAQYRRALSDVEPGRHEIWVARCAERPVGLVRLVRDFSGRIELAVEIADSHVRQGLATRLVNTALVAAADWAAPSVHLVVHPSNRAAVSLFRGLGAEFSYEDDLLIGDLRVAA